MERDSGKILYSYNCNKELPMASTTKIMTALIALENENIKSIVDIKKQYVGIEGSSIYLCEDEKLSLEDLLYGLMLRSGNDSAVAVADYVGKGVNNFIKMMNGKAKRLGAYNTNFTNPHGLSHPNHYTTAYDLALITRKALENDKFREIVKTKLWIADRKINKYFYNKNKTLWQYKYGDGVKIGYTRNAGRCLVSSATNNEGMQLIAVVLNDSNWFSDCYKLFDYGFNNYKKMVVFEEGQFIRNIEIKNGKKKFISIVTNDSLIVPLKENEKKNIKTVINLPDYVEAPVNKGKKVGSIKVYNEGELINTTHLIVNDSVQLKNLKDKIVDLLNNILR